MPRKAGSSLVTQDARDGISHPEVVLQRPDTPVLFADGLPQQKWSLLSSTASR